MKFPNATPRRGIATRVLSALALLFSAGASASSPASVAFWYAQKPPLAELARFDWAVVEPGHLQTEDVRTLQAMGAHPFAYLSVGEFAGNDQTLADAGLSAAASAHRNHAWDSQVMDLTSPAWRNYLLQRAQHYQAQGYAGLFLDTMDSFQLQPAARRETQRLALVSLLQELHKANPGLKLFFNRGFEVLPELTDVVAAVAVESIHSGWDASRKEYRPVPQADRDWLLGKLAPLKQRGVPLIAIDYLPPQQSEQATALARQLCSEGFIPFITTPQLDYLGASTVQLNAKNICR